MKATHSFLYTPHYTRACALRRTYQCTALHHTHPYTYTRAPKQVYCMCAAVEHNSPTTHICTREPCAQTPGCPEPLGRPVARSDATEDRQRARCAQPRRRAGAAPVLYSAVLGTQLTQLGSALRLHCSGVTARPPHCARTPDAQMPVAYEGGPLRTAAPEETWSALS